MTHAQPALTSGEKLCEPETDQRRPDPNVGGYVVKAVDLGTLTKTGVSIWGY